MVMGYLTWGVLGIYGNFLVFPLALLQVIRYVNILKVLMIQDLNRDFRLGRG